MALVSLNPAISELARMRTDPTSAKRLASLGSAQARPIDRVQFSQQMSQLSAKAVVTRVTLGGSERETFDIDPNIFLQAGKEEYLSTASQEEDLSSQATAERILGGITGYIYGAFRLQNPSATAEDFDIFSEQVTKGFEQGLGEAMDILSALSALDDTLSSAIGETESLVRSGLEEFFQNERQAYESADQVLAA